MTTPFTYGFPRLLPLNRFLPEARAIIDQCQMKRALSVIEEQVESVVSPVLRPCESPLLSSDFHLTKVHPLAKSSKTHSVSFKTQSLTVLEVLRYQS